MTFPEADILLKSGRRADAPAQLREGELEGEKCRAGGRRPGRRRALTRPVCVPAGECAGQTMLDTMEAPGHSRQLLLQLNNQRTKGFLCDVIIVVQNALFRAHKNVLAASSAYLKSLVVHDNLLNLDHDMVSPAVFRLVLDFIYTGRLVAGTPGGLGELLRPYRCASCDKSYKDPATLRQHEKTHWLTRPYPCTICGKKFTQRGTMTRHMRSHLGLKPFACDACGMRFTRQYRLTEHMRIHSGEKPYECQVCGGKFAQQRNLISHMKMHASAPRQPALSLLRGPGPHPRERWGRRAGQPCPGQLQRRRGGGSTSRRPHLASLLRALARGVGGKPRDGGGTGNKAVTKDPDPAALFCLCTRTWMGCARWVEGPERAALNTGAEAWTCLPPQSQKQISERSDLPLAPPKTLSSPKSDVLISGSGLEELIPIPRKEASPLRYQLKGQGKGPVSVLGSEGKARSQRGKVQSENPHDEDPPEEMKWIGEMKRTNEKGKEDEGYSGGRPGGSQQLPPDPWQGLCEEQLPRSMATAWVGRGWFIVWVDWWLRHVGIFRATLGTW
ncbi:PREDICTED: hypermethylated in cancer 1 protein [Colobus angolensis palliatus]|uniref:hypermethylated in cancer 1 protein n=1 Tax=Colobus angolensis palliatus TaxID=336983 RepID=UPI0005F4DDC1|nr:PREDICTED: hypermethylated in cancer 1 protein [Colobus angolensis palliatus]